MKEVKGTGEQVKEQLEHVKILLSLHTLTNFEIKKIIKKNLNLVVFIQEIMYPK